MKCRKRLKSANKEINSPSPAPPGIVPQLQRCLSSSAAATHGAPSGRLPREQAALRRGDHLWNDQRLQALELLKGTDSKLSRSNAARCSQVLWVSLWAILHVLASEDAIQTLQPEQTSTYTCAPLQVESLWDLLCPLLRTALSNITIETYADWGTCIATACVSFCSFISFMSLSFHLLNLCHSYFLPYDSVASVSYRRVETHASFTGCLRC